MDQSPTSIVTIETPSLGDRSYLVHDGVSAFVIDPQRDIDRVLAAADQASVTIDGVFETHIHNDYVTGGLALARECDAPYYLNGADEVCFERTPVRDGDVVGVGSMQVRPIATPGHTFTHLSYALQGPTSAVFTGGSLLIGSTGRPDLLGEEHAEELARRQHASARRLADQLAPDTWVMPTHGFGSFCSATQTTGDSSTIGQEMAQNPALTQDEAAFVEQTLAGLGAYPAYYAHMGPANAAGPSAPDLTPPGRADAAELRRRLDAGEWVVDLRSGRAFAAGHVPRTLNFAVDGQFATYLGWMIPWGRPITLLGDDADQIATAQRELVRIGIDRPAAAATGGPTSWTHDDVASFPVATFADLAEARSDQEVVILDVRQRDEYAMSHVVGAVNVPLHELTGPLSDVPPGRVWVYCASGYRSAIAASVLAAADRDVVTVQDGFDEAEEAGLPLAR